MAVIVLNYFELFGLFWKYQGILTGQPLGKNLEKFSMVWAM